MCLIQEKYLRLIDEVYADTCVCVRVCLCLCVCKCVSYMTGEVPEVDRRGLR